jgi:hypothetical protein
MGIFLCIVAFIATFVTARRSVAAGLGTLATVGYFYGILRANYPQAASHFIFDAAVLGFYLVNFFQRNDEGARRSARAILPWFGLLIAWPVVLLFFPLQEPLVQLVGLRGNIFLLPFLLIGARLKREELRGFATYLAALNLVAFIFTAAEYVIGLGPFFPHNANTEIIYHSADVAGSQFRIPSIFTGSHAYAGTMVMTLPLLIGAWATPGTSSRRRLFLLVSIFASILGIFAAASRVHIIVLSLVIIGTLLSGRISFRLRAVVLTVAAIVAIIVLSEARLQRISTLQDSNYLSQRVGGSVNSGFLDLLVEYPFGNGLGGGGTSLPFFLENRVRNRVVMENEYARIMLEQTCIGLCIWIAFILWFICRRFSAVSRTWQLTEQLSWVAVTAYFGTALIGIGLLTSIPQSMLMLLCAGSITSWRVEAYPQFTEPSSDLIALSLYEQK